MTLPTNQNPPQTPRKKKAFKETKLGDWLSTKAPHVLDAVGDLLPDQGVMGIVKRIISRDPAISPEDRIEYEKLSQEFEKEMFLIEVDDRKNARAREVEIAKTSRHDWFMHVVGSIILLAFLVVVYAAVFMDVSGTTFDRVSTMVEMLTVAIVSYFYGSSKGSADKSKMLNQ